MINGTSAAVVFVFAHQDDEYGVLPTLAAEVASGRRVHCVYLTSGNGKGCDSSVRDQESLIVLTRSGVDVRNIHFLGSKHAIDDGQLAYNLTRAFRLVEEIASPGPLHRIYTMSWEGGHADHDAAHLVAQAVSRKLKPTEGVWEFSLYNGRGVPWRFFRVMRPIRASARDEIKRLPLKEALRYALTFTAYKSQKNTWIGLAPEALLRYTLSRTTRVSPADPARVARRPHGGRLLYERMFGLPYEEFARATSAFVEETILGPGLP